MKGAGLSEASTDTKQHTEQRSVKLSKGRACKEERGSISWKERLISTPS